MRPSHRLLVLGVAAALVLSGCRGMLDTAAAVVNGDKIPEDRFQRQLDFLRADPRFAEQLAAEEGPEGEQRFARDLLTFLIHNKLIEQFAAGRDIAVPEEQMDAFMEQQAQQLGGQEEYERIRDQAGVSEAEVRDLFRSQLLRVEVAEVLLGEELPEEELRAQYEDRIAEFTEVHVSHILVNNRAQAERLVGRATPRNFAELAEEFSADPESAGQGGDLGTRPAAAFIEPFAEAVLEIPEGEIGGPVETEFGFHVIYVQERTAQPFEAVRAQLIEEVRGPIFSEWLGERVRAAEIQVNPRYGTFDEESGQVIERTASSPEPTPIQLEP